MRDAAKSLSLRGVGTGYLDVAWEGVVQDGTGRWDDDSLEGYRVDLPSYSCLDVVKNGS